MPRSFIHIAKRAWDFLKREERKKEMNEKNENKSEREIQDWKEWSMNLDIVKASFKQKSS